MLIIGIDPGMKGGVAFYCTISGEHGALPMPESRRQLYVTLGDLRNEHGSICAVVESVHSMPKQGVASTFKFGKGVGEILGILTALNAVIYEPTPQAWKAKVLRGTAKDKDAAIQFVENTYPEVALVLKGCRRAHDGMADALCLMHYGIHHAGILEHPARTYLRR